MNDRDLSVREQSAEIKKGIEEALKEIDLIQKEKGLVKTGEELEALERRIVDATDKLAGALIAQADGARWIWTRVPQLLEDLGVQLKRAYELVDFYHAVEHLGKVAACRKSWSPGERTKWVKKHKKLLRAGKIQQVIQAIKTLCRGRSSKEFGRERDYFLKNQDRMKYHTIEEMELPIGSGGMESAIRRVVNLRLKGPSIYWHVGTAEAMLTLRSFFKAGRWNMLKSQAVTATLDALI
jgi:hypothetical protein